MRALGFWRVLGLSAALVLALTGTACSAIVAGAPGPIQCDDIAGDPCPEGQRCIGGVCAAYECTPGPFELCNDRDDDCDMRVDEGLEVDADRDGYLACNARMPELQDCADSDPMIHPHVPGQDGRGDQPAEYEPCNGRDDDCDPTTTELNGCPPGQVCARPPSEVAVRCVAGGDCRVFGGCGEGTYCGPEGSCLPEIMGAECTPLTRDPRCQVGSYCDAAGQCQDTLPIGAPCNSPIECATGTCFANNAFGLPGLGGFCGVSCCDDESCAAFEGTGCFVPGTGARSCYPSAMLPADPPVCLSDEDCAGDHCRVLSNARGSRSICAPSSGGGELTLCTGASDCASGICLGEDTFLGYVGLCRRICGSARDCDSGGCSYTNESPQVSHCLDERTDGSGVTPNGCGGGCRDAFCFNDVCADACCSDDHCPNDYRCQPIDNRGWEMRCAPAPSLGVPPPG